MLSKSPYELARLPGNTYDVNSYAYTGQVSFGKIN